MGKNISKNIKAHFQDLQDPRRETLNKRHNFFDILIIAICGAICGADDWVAISIFGKAKEDWLGSFSGGTGFHARGRQTVDDPVIAHVAFGQDSHILWNKCFRKPGCSEESVFFIPKISRSKISLIPPLPRRERAGVMGITV